MNNYFAFKQFTIHQEHCAMKVCTDASLFGSWVALKAPLTGNILDIGTGTGLLSLMIAQRSDAYIDAIEIQEECAKQAEHNFSISPWKENIKLIHGSVNELAVTKKYDLIISNPPFFKDDLKSPDMDRNAAMHNISLTLMQLIESIKLHLAEDGFAAVLLPFHRTGEFETDAFRNGLYVNDRLYVRQSPTHNMFRSFLYLSRFKTHQTEAEISIHNDNREYTTEVVELMKDYYLKM